ncbi:MAG: hypoxanthine phosphoribosyltransferase [Desulfovibrio sp.]|nr:hypoxanthine phosphoribosyltransferase [Desulfovibrio sp.]
MPNSQEERLVELIGPERIAQRLREVAGQINSHLSGQRVIAVCVLKGAVIFFADLVRLLQIKELQLDFIGLSSYGAGQVSSGQITITRWLSCDVTGAWILLVEDIVDSGRSMSELLAKLAQLPVAGVSLCTLIDKQGRRECAINIDYSCFQLNSGFLVGYGLDCAEKYRQLPGIYELTH